MEIGILAGFGARTPAMDILSQKVQLAAQRGHGVIYFYWEGLWGSYAGREGGPYRRAAFSQLHSALFAPGGDGRLPQLQPPPSGPAVEVAAPQPRSPRRPDTWIPSPPQVARPLAPPQPLPPLEATGDGDGFRPPAAASQRRQPPPPPPLP